MRRTVAWAILGSMSTVLLAEEGLGALTVAGFLADAERAEEEEPQRDQAAGETESVFPGIPLS